MLWLTTDRIERPRRDASLAWRVLEYDSLGRPRAYGSHRSGDLWVDVPGVATFHLPRRSTTLRAVVDRSVGADWVLDSYYGTALPLVLQATRGLEVIHASAVLTADEARVAAFCGQAGAGKSTTASGLVARGHRRWADDAVAFRPEQASVVTAVGLPFMPKLREPSFSYFRATGAGASANGSRVVEDFQWQPARLGAIFILEPDGHKQRGIEAERLAPAEALHAVLSHAYKERFGLESGPRRRQTLDAYLELIAWVPVLRLRFRHDLEQLPDLLDEIERRLAEMA